MGRIKGEVIRGQGKRIMASTIKRGMLFSHKHYIDPADNKPLRCKVTRVAQGVVYYRPIYRKHDDGSEWCGGPSYISEAEFLTIVDQPTFDQMLSDAVFSEYMRKGGE
jgi:hypothetical protein